MDGRGQTKQNRSQNRDYKRESEYAAVWWSLLQEVWRTNFGSIQEWGADYQDQDLDLFLRQGSPDWCLTHILTPLVNRRTPDG